MAKRDFSPDQKKEIVERALRGESVGELAKEYGVGRTLIDKWCRIYLAEQKVRAEAEEARIELQRLRDIEREHQELKTAAAKLAKKHEALLNGLTLYIEYLLTTRSAEEVAHESDSGHESPASNQLRRT